MRTDFGKERHGETAAGGKMTPEYRAWHSMVNRCRHISHDRYKNYGGRGITVCPEWEHLFTTFLADMGRRPTPQHSLDRIMVDGPYAPWNCRWATVSQQAQNKQPRPDLLDFCISINSL